MTCRYAKAVDDINKSRTRARPGWVPLGGIPYALRGMADIASRHVFACPGGNRRRKRMRSDAAEVNDQLSRPLSRRSPTVDGQHGSGSAVECGEIQGRFGDVVGGAFPWKGSVISHFGACLLDEFTDHLLVEPIDGGGEDGGRDSAGGNAVNAVPFWGQLHCCRLAEGDDRRFPPSVSPPSPARPQATDRSDVDDFAAIVSD